MDYNIFKNEIEKNEARMRLPELVQHPAWKYIERALDVNYQRLDDELSDRRDFENVHEIYTLLDTRNILRKFKELPKLLLKELQPEEEEPEDDSDVFDRPPEVPPTT